MSDERSWLTSLGFDLDGDDWMQRVRTACEIEPLGELSGYALLEEAGRGGQGIVYRARRGDELVALKRILSGPFASPDRQLRFEREVEAVRSLDHPGIVRLLDARTVAGAPILVMEWIDGVSITEWAANGGRRRTPDEVVRMIRAVCDALLFAHQRGVVHRDLKPSNVLVDAAGRPHLVDFGLAKLRHADASSLTSTGFLGTLAYASPEQVEGDPAVVDARSDLYSLGVVLYEMLTGTNPFAAGPISDVVRAVTDRDPPRPSTIEASIDRELDTVVLRALAKDPEQRYASADALRRDLDHYLAGEPVEAKFESTASILARLVRRHRAASAAIGALAVLVLGFGVTMAVLYQRSEREGLRARRIQSFLESALHPAQGPTSTAYALAMLDQAADRVDAELADEPPIEAAVRHALAVRFADIRAWSRVEAQAGRLLELVPTLPEGGAREQREALRLLGLGAVERRDPEAVELMQRALDLNVREHGDDHPMVAESHRALGYALWRCSDPPRLEEARRELELAIELHARVSSEPTWGAAYAIRDHAAFLRDVGDTGLAIEGYRRTLELLDDLPERELPAMRIECLQQLGLACSTAGRWDEVEQAFRRAIELRGGRLDPSAPPSYAHVGQALFHRDRFEDAIAWFEDAVVARLEWLALENPVRRAALGPLVADVRHRGLAADAVDEIWAALGQVAPDVLPLFQFTAGRIAEAHARLGDTARAERLRAALEAAASS